MPLVSIIIPAYNRQRSLPRAIESILNQTHRDLEIIVVDDGSTDNTAAIAEEFALRDFRIRLICHGKNRGAQAARNTGARSANGRWLNFFDSDDWMLPTSIEARLTVARNQGVKVVHSDALVLRPNQDRTLFGVRPLNGSIYEALLRAPGPMFPAMIVTADAFQEMGDLDERVMAYQEWDAAIRLAKHHAFGFVPEPTFVYDCTGYDTISKGLTNSATGYEYIVTKNFSEILLRLGPKTISQHYEIIASHYIQAGASDLAMKSKWKSFLWWPSPRRAIREFWTALDRTWHSLLHVE
jgi:glycosyltransferase involved in cell wall biosynthesis